MGPLLRSLRMFAGFVLIGLFSVAFIGLVSLLVHFPRPRIYVAMESALAVWVILGLCFSVWFYRRITRLPI